MYFVASHNASSTSKSADAFAMDWTIAIEIIDCELIVCFVAHNEATTKTEGQIIEGSYSHIIAISFFMAQSFNFFVNDIGKFVWMESIIEVVA